MSWSPFFSRVSLTPTVLLMPFLLQSLGASARTP